MLSELKSIYEEKNGLSKKLSEFADSFVPQNLNQETPSNQSLGINSPLSQLLNNMKNFEQSNYKDEEQQQELPEKDVNPTKKVSIPKGLHNSL